MKNSFYLFVLIILSSIACAQPQNKTSAIVCFDSIESIRDNLFNKTVSSIDKYKECFTIKRKEVVSDEDNNLKWENYQFNSKGGFLLIEAETSWNNKGYITRITVYDSSLKLLNNIYVGQSYRQFRNKIKYAYWDESYGTFYVKIAKNDNISIELQIRQTDNLKLWETDLSKINDEVKVKSIIINSIE